MQGLMEQFKANIFMLSLQEITTEKCSDKWTLFVDRGNLTQKSINGFFL